MKKFWASFISELIGTALLVGVGLSIVIFMFGTASPVTQILPGAGIRRLITGFLFGTTGALIALSPVGKVSGAHINPVVSLAFWLEGKMRWVRVIGFIIAQFAGAALGVIPLLLWGTLGRSVQFGATFPGHGYSAGTALLGEIVTTFALVIGLFIFVSHKPIQRYTPLLFPFLYALMVFVEAPVSGTSTNPARSFGPSLISGEWQAWWVYWIGPVVGAGMAVLVHKFSWLNKLEIEIAKIYHFRHDPYEIFKEEFERE